MQRPCLLATTRRVEVVDKGDLRLPQLIRYTIILLSGRAHADAEPPDPPHEF